MGANWVSLLGRVGANDDCTRTSGLEKPARVGTGYLEQAGHKIRPVPLSAGLSIALAILALVLGSENRAAGAADDELVVVSLGDSDIAGNGAGNYYGKTNCH